MYFLYLTFFLFQLNIFMFLSLFDFRDFIYYFYFLFFLVLLAANIIFFSLYFFFKCFYVHLSEFVGIFQRLCFLLDNFYPDNSLLKYIFPQNDLFLQFLSLFFLLLFFFVHILLDHRIHLIHFLRHLKIL